MKLLTALLLLCALALGVSGCGDSTSGTAPLIVGKGTILPSQAECHSWFLQADSGALFELNDLGAEFQHVDLRVRFTVLVRNDMASICMRGSKVDVISMTRL